MGAVFAIPPLWPVFLALGWLEMNLAERIGRRDDRAVVLAARLLMLPGLGCAAVALLAVAAAFVLPDDLGAEEQLRWAWVVPATLALAHWFMARSIRRPTKPVPSR